MNDTDKVIEIPEYSPIELEGLDEEKDLPYLKKKCFKASKPFPYKLSLLRDNKVAIENTSYSGIIQLENYRIHFATKVKTNLFYMLTFLRDEHQFYYDPEVVIATPFQR